jgi:hypothetical protein
MARGAAKFASAVVACVVAFAPIASRAQNAVDFPPETPPPPEKTEKAADDCLTAPGGEAPSGQRWVYHIERGTQRHCWYLRDKAERASQPVPSIAAVAKPLVRMGVTPPRQNAEAHAELPTARGRFDGDNAAIPRGASGAFGGRTPPIAAADDDVRGTLGMSRTPQPLDTFSAPPPAVDPPVAAAANDAVTDSSADLGASAGPPPAPDAGPRPDAAPPKTSLQRLLVVIFGALAFAGVTASLIHRFAYIWGKRNARLRRRMLWQSAKRARARAPQAATARAPTAPAASAPAASLQNAAADQANPAAANVRNRQDQDAQGQIEELLGRVAQRVNHGTVVPALVKLANSQAAAAGHGRRSQARRGARA